MQVLALVRNSVFVLSVVHGLVLGIDLVSVSAFPPPPLYLSLPIPCHASCVSDCSRSTNGNDARTDTGPRLGQVKRPTETSTTFRYRQGANIAGTSGEHSQFAKSQ